MNYWLYYGMKSNPFDKETQEIIQTVDFKEMTYRLNYLKELRGIGVFTGRPGAGKTFTLRQFSLNLNSNLYKVCYLQLTTVTISDFYQQLAEKLGLEGRGRKATLFRLIQERIEELYEIERITPVIIIDEAQFLNGQIFLELMLLMNFKMDSKKNCLLILAGLPQLGQTLQRAQFEAFRQRIATTYQVVGLEPEEVSVYVEGKLASVGVKDVLFPAEVLATLASSAGSSMRKLNRLLTQCLMIGALKKQRVIDQEIVFEANAELNFS